VTSLFGAACAAFVAAIGLLSGVVAGEPLGFTVPILGVALIIAVLAAGAR
jgi:hypothetical protein